MPRHAYGKSLPPEEDQNRFGLSEPQPRNSHWSIAWSDLMMTMFIVFLSLFVYQSLHKEQTLKDTGEIIGGEIMETSPPPPPPASSRASLPFPELAGITPGAPTLRKVSSVPLLEIDFDRIDFSAPPEQESTSEEPVEPAPVTLSDSETPAGTRQTSQQQSTPQPAPASAQLAVAPPKSTTETQIILEPLPLGMNEASMFERQQHSSIAKTPQETVSESLYLRGRNALDQYALDDFASIDLLPGKAVRIVLTGDLLFAKAQAELSPAAVDSLKKIGMAIKDTPHIIHVEGHTDSLPITGGRFTNNWDLSLARANTVANFLMTEMQLDPGQVIVSGYASHRPVDTNDTVAGRARNRRVEIVIARQ